MKRTISTASVATLLSIGGWVAPVIAADSWVGQYTGHVNSYRWEATITNRAAGVYNVHVSVASKMPLCSGDISVPAKLVGGKLLINDEDCTLSVSRRGAKGIRIEEKRCSAHGAACGFDSELTRNSAKSDPGEATGTPPAGGTASAATYVGRWSEEPYTLPPGRHDLPDPA